MPSEPRALAAPDLPADDQLLAFADSILAQAAAQGTARESASRTVLAFVLAESHYAIPVGCCREIVRVGEVTRIPEAPSQVRGVFNLRGRVIPVIELRLRVGLERAILTPRSRLVVVAARGRLFALLVDRVLGINKIAVTDIEAEPDASPGSVLAGRVRVGGEIVRLFDPDTILLPTRGGEP